MRKTRWSWPGLRWLAVANNDDVRRLRAEEGVRSFTRYPLTVVWDPQPWASEWRAWTDGSCRYLRLGRLMLTWHGCLR